MKTGLTHLKNLSTLQWALGASLLVHGALLTVRFVNPEGFNRVFQDTPLEVILVNARGDERPEKATAIAQASLAGGGEAQRGRATSPLPPSATARLGDTPGHRAVARSSTSTSARRRSPKPSAARIRLPKLNCSCKVAR